MHHGLRHFLELAHSTYYEVRLPRRQLVASSPLQEATTQSRLCWAWHLSAFATGVKIANPELDVIVFTGDGDMAGIGGNHFIHAARRNLDLTVICINNATYGMTGGQVSPTTPPGSIATTAPHGALEEPFDLCRLAIGAGAPYVARWVMGYPYETIAAVEAAIRKKGFGFVEIMAPCPTGFGKANDQREAKDAWDSYKENTITRPRGPRRQHQDRHRHPVAGRQARVQPALAGASRAARGRGVATHSLAPGDTAVRSAARPDGVREEGDSPENPRARV